MTDNDYANVKSFLYGILVGMLIVFFVLDFTNLAEAKCIQHQVQKNETLKSISEDYYGHKKYWLDIYYQNELKKRRLKTGQVLHLFMPDKEDEWYAACGSLVLQRLAEKKREYLSHVAQAIPAGILLAERMLGYPNPMEKLEMCRWAITTAEHESMYGEFFVGAAGEIGPYQMLLNTARLTYKWYGDVSERSDLELVKQFIHFNLATEMFILHFHKLYTKYNGLWLAWKRYNGHGRLAEEYAHRIIIKYRQIKKLQPIKCKDVQ